MQYIEKIFTCTKPSSEICPKKNPSETGVSKGYDLKIITSYLVGVEVLFGVVVPPNSFAIAMFFVVFSRVAASCVVQVSILVCASVSFVLQSARPFVASSGLTSPLVTFADHSVNAVVFSAQVVLNEFHSAVIASMVAASCSAILVIS